MKKSILLLLLLLIPFSLYSEEFPFIGKLNADRVNLRSGPDINTPVIRTLEVGKLFIVKGKTANWFCVNIPDDIPLYIYKKLTDIQENVAKTKKDNINVRTGPSTRSPVVGNAKKGDTFQIISIGEEWLKVKPTDAFSGYIFGDYITYEMDIETYRKQMQIKKEAQALLEQTEKIYDKESKKDIQQMNIEDLVDRYKNLLSDKYPDGVWKQKARKRLFELKLKSARKEYIEAKTKLEEKILELSGTKKEKIPPPIATGVIDDLGMIFRRPGTHKLIDEKGQIQYFLKSNNLNLNRYTHIPVALWGEIKEAQGWKTQVIVVENIRALKELQKNK